MAYGPQPQSKCREITMLCKLDRHYYTTTFEVWERNGLSGEDAPRNILYTGDSWAQAYAAMTAASETISEGLR